jgi:hypothetical protein
MVYSPVQGDLPNAEKCEKILQKNSPEKARPIRPKAHTLFQQI